MMFAADRNTIFSTTVRRTQPTHRLFAPGSWSMSVEQESGNFDRGGRRGRSGCNGEPCEVARLRRLYIRVRAGISPVASRGRNRMFDFGCADAKYERSRVAGRLG